MNNVCLVDRVAVLFRRLVHVVSTVSVAQQYHFYKRNCSMAEHTSPQPTIEHQNLSLEQTLLSPDRSTIIQRVLVEQWDRLGGKGFWESWRSSSLIPAQQPVQQLHLSVYPSHVEALTLIILLQIHRHYYQQGCIRPIQIHLIKPLTSPPTSLRNLSHQPRIPILLHPN